MRNLPGWPGHAVLAAVLAMAVVMPAATAVEPDIGSLREQVTDAERGFAATMARRDLAAFGGYLSAQAVFFTGGRVQRGKAEVLAEWQRFFDGPQAPFSWSPDQVEVLADGTLAHSSGPVLDAAGKPIARFNSIWRQESPGVWRIVFDKGSPLPRPAP